MVARLVAFGIGVLLVLAVTLGCFYVVEPGERGVHVTLGTMSDQFVAPGFGMKLPVITQIWRVNVQQDTREVGAECFSSDLQQINLQLKVLYRIPETSVVSVLRDYAGHPFEKLILPRVQEATVLHLRLAARGGSALDPEGREGAASMMATLLRRGTAARSAVQIAAAVEATGGSLESAASVDYCVVKSEALARDADRMLELMADVVLRPAFPPEEIERERANALAGLYALLEDPGSVASRAFRTEAYGAHPYGRPADGTRRSFAEIERADIVRAHASAFVPSNCVLVVVGPVSASGLRERVRSAFSTLSGGRRPWTR